MRSLVIFSLKKFENAVGRWVPGAEEVGRAEGRRLCSRELTVCHSFLEFPILLVIWVE